MKRMSISRRQWLPQELKLQALGDKLEHRFNLFTRNVELFHDLLNAHIFEILEDRSNWHTGILKYPRATHLAGNAFRSAACDQSRVAIFLPPFSS
jgi:hypothetical protein